MKKLNTLKLIIAIGLASCFNAEAQDVGNEFWNSVTFNAKDIGRAITEDPTTGNTYVAGETNVGLSNQAIRIIKYSNGATITKKYDSIYFNETVVQIIYSNSKIYLIGNATDTAGVSSMFLLRLNTNLGIEKSRWFTSTKHSKPVKAVFSNNQMYIACSKKVSGVNKFALIKVDTDFLTIASTVPSDTTYRRTAKDLVLNGSYLYVAGSAISGTLTAVNSGFAMKFSSSLGLVWEHNGSTSVLNPGYNTIASNSSYIYVGGTEFSSNSSRWVMRRLSKTTGSSLATHRIGATNEFGAIVKITRATNDSIYIAGYLKSQSLNHFTLIAAKYNSSLGYYSPAVSSMAYDTKLNDAVCFSDGSKSILTGSTKIGTNYAIYFTEFSNYNQQVIGGETENNRNAAGNKIILSSGVSGSYAKLIGFVDAKTGNQPEDLQFVTKFIATQIDRLSFTSTSVEQSLFTMYPNPATDEITVESTESIRSFVIYDMMGKSVMEQQIGEETFQERINISALPKGIYLLKVNNNATQKLIKN